MNRCGSLLTFLSLTLCGGCASYVVPGPGANLQAMSGSAMSDQQRTAQTDPSITAMLDRKPLGKFPATVAIVRVQGADYVGRTVELYGAGNFTVVLSRDVEKPDQLDQLEHLPMLAGLEPINRLELPTRLSSEQDLRKAAALVHADMLLIYTFDDRFDDRDIAEGLTVLTIGIVPTKSLTVTSTASAVLLDTRSGFVYGASEAVAKKTTLANCWGEDAAADAVREQVEGDSFGRLVSDVQGMWGRVVAQYGPASDAPSAAQSR